ncbi:MAG: YeeE/YedE family protein [Planctomycetes bacterium]|nr:YeeE/YedE family protein [Planctomycetota bacterium]
MSEPMLGLLTGVFFGALLQQGRVLRFEKQVGAMLLRDMTILKFMLTAIVVGMVGVNLLVSLGAAAMSVKTTILGANLIGGVLFGLGWAFMGFCPGTSLGAIAEGRWHAVWALLGMIVGATLFAEAYPVLQDTVLTWGNLGKITLPQVLGVTPWLVIPGVAAGFVLLLGWFEKLDL